MSEPIQTTLVIAHTDEDVLLGMKKRGFGAGRWNGFGGKVHEGESIEAAAHRELAEECGLTASAFQAAGILRFSFEDLAERPIDVHLFRVRQWSGEPCETDEMQPQWFAHEDVPYDEMWPDDRFWLPRFLSGIGIDARFHFKDFDTLLTQDITELP